MQTAELVEIRWHGRGGQGAVTSAELLARAAIDEGKYAQAFPSFGPERRGAPVLAFDRISKNEPIRVRAEILEPDAVVILDSGLVSIVNVTSGLKDGGTIVLNTKRSLDDVSNEFDSKWRIAVVDATHIAQELLGVNIVNTSMIGALIKATGVVDIESLAEPLDVRFGRLAERNMNAMKKAFEDTQIKE
ncbi:MAG: 2-oxoacid:acceptor oxidoreductase family protein [Dehalococcoidales bacterium]|nr:MAG: 2-oxoacid:acceptor oxidoreductase family protein [Dehalococcoidales bacterium]